MITNPYTKKRRASITGAILSTVGMLLAIKYFDAEGASFFLFFSLGMLLLAWYYKILEQKF